MRHVTRIPCLAVLGMALAACVHTPPGQPELDSAPKRRAMAASGTVIDGAQLNRMGGDLLTALLGRVNNIRVHFIPGRRCPAVVMRGPRTVTGSGDPLIYVDGTAMSDTCILREISANEVASVELYPGGIAPRAGVAQSANGVILVFLNGF